jgi:phosphomannomutase/phosphoglucomutase
MVTASHNENGWTGVKMGAARPLTFGPDEMGRLKEIVLGAAFLPRPGGAYEFIQGFAERYMADLANRPKLKRKLKVVAACGNGPAGAFAPNVLERVGCEVVPLDCDLDWTFPNYNPNTEDLKMLHALRDDVLRTKTDVGLAFDGDGDRCGVVDDEGEEIFADKVGVMLARDLSAKHGGGTFVVDVKSTGVPHRPGTARKRCQDRLLEDRPFLYQTPRRRTEGTGRIREVRSFLLQSARGTRL